MALIELLACLCFALDETLAGVGLILLVIAIMAVPVGRRAMLPTDADLDLWLEEDLRKLVDRALEECNVDASEQVRDPVTVIGPAFQGLSGIELRWCKGRDGRVRFTPVYVVIILFLEYQIALCQCAFDLTTGKPWDEGADVILYRHVVSISTKVMATTYALKDLDRGLLKRNPDLAKTAVDGKIHLKEAESFNLVTTAGGSLTVLLRDPMLFKEAGDESFPVGRAREAVQSIRSRLREVAAEGKL